MWCLEQVADRKGFGITGREDKEGFLLFFLIRKYHPGLQNNGMSLKYIACLESIAAFFLFFFFLVNAMSLQERSNHGSRLILFIYL